MNKSQLGRWLIAIPAIAVIAFVWAEKSNLLKSDTITAVACTKELLQGKPDEVDVINQYRDAIFARARQYDLPPELLAAIIYGHQRDLTPFRKFTDCAGSALGVDLSLGLAQIKVSNATTNDKLEFAAISPGTFKKYRAILLDPTQNIAYQAKELRRLLERDIRSPGITSDELVHDPFVMALLMSEYRMGRQEATSAASRLSGNAFFDLSYMLDESVYMFDRNMADTIQIQNSVREYLAYIYCDSGIFNMTACEDWRD